MITIARLQQMFERYSDENYLGLQMAASDVLELLSDLREIRERTRPLIFCEPASEEHDGAMEWLGYLHTEHEWKQPEEDSL